MANFSGLGGVSAYLVWLKVANTLPLHKFYISKISDQYSVLEALKRSDDKKRSEILKDLDLGHYKTNYPNLDTVLTDFKSRPNEIKRSLILDCIINLPLTDDEKITLLSTQKDKNGVYYSKVNIKNININDLVPMLLDVLLALSETDLDLKILDPAELEFLNKHRVDIKDDAARLLEKSLSLTDTLTLSLKGTVKRWLQMQR